MGERGADAAESTPDGWFVRLARRDAPRLRLYAFPHAGAGPGALGPLAEALPAEIEPWAVALPGRQARIGEPTRTDLDGLVADLAADLTATPGDHALLGWCGGALLAHQVAQVSRPAHLFVASFAAPDVARIARRLHELPSERFWEVVLAQGGVAPELAAHTELRPLFEEAIRADFALLSGYHHTRGERLPVPVTVLHGVDDAELSTGALLGWRRHTAEPPGLVRLDGGHWLVDENPVGLAEAIADVLLRGRVPATRPTARPVGPPAVVPPAPAQDVLATIERHAAAAVGRPIGDRENFFDAGLTSRTLAEVHARSVRESADPLPITALFAYPNLLALRGFLTERGPR